MAILVTGGAGFVGSHMVLNLLESGQDVVVIDDLSTGLHWAVPEQATMIVGDIGDLDLVADVIKRHGVDAIVHFAGSISAPESVRDPLGYYLNNAVKSRSLMQAALANGVEVFVNSSTAAVYSLTADMPILESTALEPTSPYGRSKLMTELMLRDAGEAHGLRHVSLRFFNVAGADPKGRMGQSTKGSVHLIKVACETALGKRERIEVFGTDYPTRDGTCIRDFIHVTDLVQGHRLALDYLRAGGKSDVFNCCYGLGFSVREVIDAVGRVSGRPVEAKFSPRRPNDAAMIVASSTKIRRDLGWSPQFDNLDAMVGHALAWEATLGRRADVA